MSRFIYNVMTNNEAKRTEFNQRGLKEGMWMGVVSGITSLFTYKGVSRDRLDPTPPPLTLLQAPVV
jgi:hypothetical protein